MKQTLIILIGVLISVSTFAQNKKLKTVQNRHNQPQTNRLDKDDGSDQRSVVDERPKPPITDYKIISVKGDTTYVDTTLNIHKDYKYNYLRKDNFGLLPFSNVGQTYTSLTYQFDKENLMPLFGARAAQFAYLRVTDIHYYHVPTPWTQLFFKTTFEQGQLLDAFFTSNPSPQFNFFIAYKGLHSLGKYRHAMTSQGSFRTGFSYQTKNKRYNLKTHFVAQNLSAEQNGGLTDLSNLQFASTSGQYKDRTVLDMKYENGERIFRAKRFYINHHFDVVKGNDSTANNQIRIGHIFDFTDKEFTFDQKDAFPLYWESFQNSKLHDFTEFQHVSNTLFAQYQNNILGKILFKVRHFNYNYGYQRKLYLENEVIPNRLKGNIYAVGASYQKNIGGFDISGDAMLNITGDFNGNYIRAKSGYALDSLNRVEAGFSVNSSQPNYNFLLFQSNYKNYNWYNKFENVQKQRIYFQLNSEKLLDINASYTRIHNYAYFGLRKNTLSESSADTLVTPYQYDGDVSYLKIKAHREFSFWRFSLDNTVMYQEVLDGKSVMRVPSVITRNSFYYKDYWFHRNLYLQTGFILNYFSSFKADAFDPVLAEFYVQDHQKLEGFPRLDFFFNAKVRQTRIFFKLENLTTLIDGNGHYAAPYQPYRDWVIRFGLVWDFFL